MLKTALHLLRDKTGDAPVASPVGLERPIQRAPNLHRLPHVQELNQKLKIE